MPRVQLPDLKPTHKVVQAYYAALAQFDLHHVTRETAVRQPFLDLLRPAAGQRGWSLEPEYPMQGNRGNRIVVDAALRDAFWRVHGYWEAKDTDDDLYGVTDPVNLCWHEWITQRFKVPSSPVVSLLACSPIPDKVVRDD